METQSKTIAANPKRTRFISHVVKFRPYAFVITLPIVSKITLKSAMTKPILVVLFESPFCGGIWSAAVRSILVSISSSAVLSILVSISWSAVVDSSSSSSMLTNVIPIDVKANPPNATGRRFSPKNNQPRNAAKKGFTESITITLLAPSRCIASNQARSPTMIPSIEDKTSIDITTTDSSRPKLSPIPKPNLEITTTTTNPNDATEHLYAFKANALPFQ
mmetsp:Transcript_14352/g.21896  ORF Transcript_14352/g.21896 Transcript_14352/m.21896 type:complete len:219 (-) Transcript_14352:39-695(-)